MAQEMLQFCIDRGILLDKHILDILDNFEDVNVAKNLVEQINHKYNQKILTKKFFMDNKDKLNQLFFNYTFKDKNVLQQLFEKLGLELDENMPQKIEIEEKIESKVHSVKVFSNNPRKLEVKDFVNNFKNRFNELRNILQQRSSLENLVSINRIQGQTNFSIIAIIFNKRVTKNGNIILEVEDLTGRTTLLISKSRADIFEKSKEILLDEVIGFKCSGNGEMNFVNDLFFPDIRVDILKKSSFEEYAAFTSDVHVGSDKFLEKNFLKFIEWLNGEVGDENQKQTALKVKYLFITGDTIDGVGVYPGQESQLIMKDVDQQYERLVEILSTLRKDISIIMCAGQHDAVRLAEPQPIMGDFFGEVLKTLPNTHLVTNPSLIEIGSDVKFKVLMYHGASMHGVINNIEALRLGKGHDSPTDVVKYLLKKRHLAPTHSLVTYTPFEEEDPLLIKEVPDIVATGDLHRPEISNYNGVMLIASSCWQSRTPFEEKVGNNPDPCKVPLLNLKTREVKILDFSNID